MSADRLNVSEILTHIRAHCLALCRQEWPGLGEIVDAVLSDPLDPLALLPIATGRGVGADLAELEPAAAALILVSLALRIVDDVADRDDPDALYQQIGSGRAMHVALALQAIGAREFSRPRPGQNAISDRYARTFLQVCQGQDQDLTKKVETLADYEAIVQLKTVAAYEFAAVLGALSATADDGRFDAPARAGVIAQCSLCGTHLGWMVQILDDIEALWFPEQDDTAETEKMTFPVLVGLRQHHPNAQVLRELYRAEDDNRARRFDALTRARRFDAATRVRICTLLDEMGVRSQLMKSALDHRDAALEALGGSFHPEGAAVLKLWLDWLLRNGAHLLADAPAIA